MATWLRQSTAVDVALGPFVDSTDGFTPETALSLTQAECRLKKGAGAWAQKNNATTAPHEEEGWYEVNLSTTDTDTLGIMVLAVYIAGALPVWREFMVLPAAVYDAYLSTGVLGVNVTQWGAVAPNALVSGRVDASVGAMAPNVLTAAATAADFSTEVNTGMATQASVDAIATEVAGVNGVTPATSADVLTQVNAALDTAVSQPGSGAPAANPSIRTAIAYLFKAWRNRVTQTDTQYSLYNDNATTIDQKATFSDDTVTADRGEIASGP